MNSSSSRTTDLASDNTTRGVTALFDFPRPCARRGASIAWNEIIGMPSPAAHSENKATRRTILPGCELEGLKFFASHV